MIVLLLWKIYDNKRKFYYVDNDFFNNKYPYTLNGDYYCIKQRQVSEWVSYSKFNIYNKKIIKFNKYIDN